VPPRNPGCDPGIKPSNPLDIFADPDFTSINRGISAPENADSYEDVPIVLQGNSDMTYELTRWIAANPAAEAFLHGTADHGMTINRYYKDTSDPADAFATSDNSANIQAAYSPVASLSSVASDLVLGAPPGDSYDANCPHNTQYCSTYTAFPQEPSGSRALFSVLDNADAEGFDVPTAAILNPAGRYVQPTAASMTAALNSMVTASNGITQQVNMSSNNPAEYPLTMVIYAMVPTSGVPQATADLIARWLRYVTGPGQASGELPGELPVGYLPLPSKLRAETLAVADAVQRQAGNTGTSTTPTPGASGTVSPSPGGSLTASPSPTSTLGLPKLIPRIETVAVRDPLTSGIARYALPALLILGGLAALGGAASLTIGSPGAAAVLTRLRRTYRAGFMRRRKS
jgi:hypothetical protein